MNMWSPLPVETPLTLEGSTNRDVQGQGVRQFSCCKRGRPESSSRATRALVLLCTCAATLFLAMSVLYTALNFPPVTELLFHPHPPPFSPPPAPPFSPPPRAPPFVPPADPPLPSHPPPAEWLSSIIAPSALPILRATADSRSKHASWHAYVEQVYGQPIDVDTELDLNTFEWFYYSSPLLEELSLSVRDDVDLISLGSPWSLPDGLLYRLHTYVAQEFAPAGYFVWRGEETFRRARVTYTARRPVEVLRASCYEEVGGNIWFYPLRGSGVFLDLAAAYGESSASAGSKSSGMAPGNDRGMRSSGGQRPVAASLFAGADPELEWFHLGKGPKHALPELVLFDENVTGVTSCPRWRNEDGSAGEVFPLRSGLDGHNRSCPCNPSLAVLNCGLARLELPLAQTWHGRC